MLRRSLLGIALAALGCSASAREDDVVASSAPIVGGQADGGHPAVVGLEVFGLQVFCSGTLIAPRTILTAGHCVNVATSFARYSAVFGADDGGSSIRITKQVRHPSYTGEGKRFDVAVMQLERAPEGIAPLSFADRSLPELAVGAPLTHVGFGAMRDGQWLPDGKKRIVTTPITKVDEHFVYSGNATQNTCTGDSGGPGLVTGSDGGEVVVSLVSDGPDCSSEGWDVRVDEVAEWIRTTASAWEPTY